MIKNNIAPLYHIRTATIVSRSPGMITTYARKHYFAHSFSKILLFNNHLMIKFPNRKYRILYDDITDIKQGVFFLQIIHKNPKIPKYVYIMYISLSNKLYRILANKINKPAKKDNKLLAVRFLSFVLTQLFFIVLVYYTFKVDITSAIIFTIFAIIGLFLFWNNLLD